MITISIADDELRARGTPERNKGILYKSIIEAVEKPLLEQILERTEGNQIKAARMLGLNRNTLRAKIKKLNINVEKWKIT